MKNLVLVIALVVCSVVKAQSTPATIYLSDGSKKEGLADFVKFDSKSVKFKTDKKAKAEKIDQNLIDRIDYKEDDGTEFTAESLNSWNIGFLKYEYSKRKNWFYKIYEKGNFAVYIVKTGAIIRIVNNTPQGLIKSGDISYFYRRKGEDTVYFGFMEDTAGLAIHASRRKQIKSMIDEMFKGNCSKAKDDVDKIEFNYREHKDFLKVLDILIKNKCK